MAQRTLGRALAAVALTATLTLALPAQANAAPLNKPVSLWEWVSGLLEEKIAAVWGPAKRPNERTRRQGNSKAGGCIDPNGCTTYQTSTTPPRPNCVMDEAGGCIDPNG